MKFPTKVCGIPCSVQVTVYRKAVPMRVWGSGMGDCDPPEPEEFEFRLLDRKGYPARWLERKLTPALEQKIFEDFQNYLDSLNQKEP